MNLTLPSRDGRDFGLQRNEGRSRPRFKRLRDAFDRLAYNNLVMTTLLSNSAEFWNNLLDALERLVEMQIPIRRLRSGSVGSLAVVPGVQRELNFRLMKRLWTGTSAYINRQLCKQSAGNLIIWKKCTTI